MVQVRRHAEADLPRELAGVFRGDPRADSLAAVVGGHGGVVKGPAALCDVAYHLNHGIRLV
eukprot:CAMPEP_0169456370 /NCGR_PEP_ID=MMETSP1042-20121227/16315_1 /TAXON_ID=464988 /ORGANISM="Hemiselmis andersenii, Strain CCMP1180" /LENGTH=60 /DNA_ID=CAMNT_0009568585 /DNA_START=1 /DNA_END=183 /DNA_ORIENTATION=-